MIFHIQWIQSIVSNKIAFHSQTTSHVKNEMTDPVISVAEFQRVQQEVLRLKNENLDLTDHLNRSQSVGPRFLSTFFSGSESGDVDRAQQEEAELKKALASLQAKNDTLRDQLRDLVRDSSVADRVETLEQLFLTKKRELTRMMELNESTLSDLSEEIDLARELCESLENGRASLARDKEVIENSIASLQIAKQSIEARTKDLEELNRQLLRDLGEKEADGNNVAGIEEKIQVETRRLRELEKEYQRLSITFDAQEEELYRVECQKEKEVAEIDDQRNKQTEKIENQLRSLRHELQSLKTRDRNEETVQIDVDSLVRENKELQDRIDEMDRKKLALAQLVNDHQTDCAFLGKWLKKEQVAHTDPDTVFRDLIQKQCNAREELAQLKKNCNNI